MKNACSITLISALIALSATFSLADDATRQKTLYLPHVEANDDFFTGLSLLNTGKESVEVRLTGYNQFGSPIKNKAEIVISPGVRYLSAVTDIFGYKSAPDVSWVKLEYSGDLRGFGLMGNDGQLARIPFKSEGNDSLILPFVTSGDGLFTKVYILNPGLGFASVTFTAFDEKGNLLKNVPFETPVLPKQKLITSASAIFGAEVSRETSWMKIESDTDIIGFGLAGSLDRIFSVPME